MSADAMQAPRCRRPRATAAGLLLAALLLADAARAGTDPTLSGWMSAAPAIDGIIGAAEWAAARSTSDVVSGVTVWFGNDARTLYVAVRDAGDVTFSINDAVQLHFDDEGGTAPTLDDGAFDSLACQNDPQLGEGLFYLDHVQVLWYGESLQVSQCAGVPINDRASFRTSLQPEGVSYEAAIPLDGPTALRALAGQQVGYLLRVFRENVAVACFPGCGTIDPAAFAHLWDPLESTCRHASLSIL